MLTACAFPDTPAGARPIVASRCASAVGSAWEREPWMPVQQAARESLEAGGGGGLMDLAGKYLVVWLSPEASETFLGVLEPSQSTP